MDDFIYRCEFSSFDVQSILGFYAVVQYIQLLLEIESAVSSGTTAACRCAGAQRNPVLVGKVVCLLEFVETFYKAVHVLAIEMQSPFPHLVDHFRSVSQGGVGV